MTTAATPVRTIPGDQNAPAPSGIALHLSGGGYRAMVFHLGALWRLNELGYLPTLARISSISGGSITAGTLGLKWTRLQFDAGTGVSPVFVHEVVDTVRALPGVTLDVSTSNHPRHSSKVSRFAQSDAIGLTVSDVLVCNISSRNTLRRRSVDGRRCLKYVCDSTGVCR